MGASATEAAFKAASLNEYRVIHLAVHAFADSTFPDRAALVLLSDPAAGEDGFLQASEIAQMRFPSDLVVLSACDTAVGPLQGQDGVANLSRAFLEAGARSVISTLWEIDDNSSLFLMKRFYAHLSANQSAATALTSAKRDMLRTLGSKALPYQWAEVRGAEAHTLLKAWNTGHPGGAATIHANDALSGLIRLESLVAEATSAPQQTLIAEAVDLVVFVDEESSIKAGRKVRELLLVTGYSNGNYQVERV
jgi:hypothetical protein